MIKLIRALEVVRIMLQNQSLQRAVRAVAFDVYRVSLAFVASILEFLVIKVSQNGEIENW